MTTASPGMALIRTWSKAGRSSRTRSPAKSFSAPRIMFSGLAKSSMRIGVFFPSRSSAPFELLRLSPRRLAVPDPDGLFLGAAQFFGTQVRTQNKDAPRGNFTQRFEFFKAGKA